MENNELKRKKRAEIHSRFSELLHAAKENQDNKFLSKLWLVPTGTIVEDAFAEAFYSLNPSQFKNYGQSAQETLVLKLNRARKQGNEVEAHKLSSELADMYVEDQYNGTDMEVCGVRIDITTNFSNKKATPIKYVGETKSYFGGHPVTLTYGIKTGNYHPNYEKFQTPVVVIGFPEEELNVHNPEFTYNLTEFLKKNAQDIFDHALDLYLAYDGEEREGHINEDYMPTIIKPDKIEPNENWHPSRQEQNLTDISMPSFEIHPQTQERIFG